MPPRSIRRWLMRLAEPVVSGARGGLQAQEVGELILDQELGDVALAELLPQLDERAVADLLAERDARAEVARFGRRRDLEEIEVERAADRLAERRGDEAGRDPAGGRRERRPLAGAELVDRAVEHDQREDVALLERRVARERQLRRLRACR